MPERKNSLPSPKSRPTDISITRKQTIEALRQIKPDAPSRMTTEELAHILRIQAGSVRRALCIHGHYCGIVPIRLPNGRLIWPIA